MKWERWSPPWGWGQGHRPVRSNIPALTLRSGPGWAGKEPRASVRPLITTELFADDTPPPPGPCRPPRGERSPTPPDMPLTPPKK